MADTEHERRSLIPRRMFLYGLSTLPLGLAGCQFANSAATPATTPEAAAYPVTVRHVYGETVIKSEPLRIATLGPASNDVCLALGVVPLAMPLSDAQPNGATPWFDALWRKFGVDMPLLLDESNGRILEELKGMGPDLILAAGGELTRAQYDELSEIAPVIAPSENLATLGWRSSLTLIGQALGRPEEAAQVLSRTEASIKGELSNYADLKGTSFVVVGAFSPAGAHYNVMDSGSHPVRMLEDWGLSLAPSVSVLNGEISAEESSAFGLASFSLPPDRVNELDSDIALVMALHREIADLQPAILDGIPAYGRGAGLLADSRDAAAALETGSCLSAQWLSRTLLPQVAKLAYRASRNA